MNPLSNKRYSAPFVMIVSDINLSVASFTQRKWNIPW